MLEMNDFKERTNYVSLISMRNYHLLNAYQRKNIITIKIFVSYFNTMRKKFRQVSIIVYSMKSEKSIQQCT